MATLPSACWTKIYLKVYIFINKIQYFLVWSVRSFKIKWKKFNLYVSWFLNELYNVGIKEMSWGNLMFCNISFLLLFKKVGRDTFPWHQLRFHERAVCWKKQATTNIVIYFANVTSVFTTFLQITSLLVLIHYKNCYFY